ncbi:hypothetical protein [Parathalassolituus penaei]|uniref:Uncharacterized protein n=1 Tax=Parathalassolituus penaei TaxID=2997323 RepID=A0A9X3EEJ0_9GAMM|nr:hypothetical protein [Parathalassolituus penaei]MCY0966137.1 hypothetical protein [Parathalassolituus penaei]
MSLMMAILAAYFSFISFDNLSDGKAGQIISNLTGYAVTLMSILVASGAIVMSVAGSRLIRNMTQTGHYKMLIDSMLCSGCVFLVASLVGVVFMYTPAVYDRYGVALLSSLFSVGMYSFVVSTHYLYKVLLRINN